MSHEFNHSPQPLYTLNPIADKAALYDGLQEYLSKLKALVHLALSDDFPDYSRATIFNYLWTVSSHVETVKDLIAAIGLNEYKFK